MYWAATIRMQNHPFGVAVAHEHRPIHRSRHQLGAHVIGHRPASTRRECSSDGTQVHVSFTAAQIFDTNSAMIAATVLAETRSPSSCRSAVILGDSYVPPEAS